MTAGVDALGDTSTLAGVILGAAAATLGSFAAVSFERFLSRRAAERDAALMFGEMFHTLCRYLDFLREAHGRGDPFGPITIRMLRGVRREIDVYDRNRERMLMVRDGVLRLKIASLMAQATFALERVLESTDQLATESAAPKRNALADGREQAFGFLIECADELPTHVRRLAALAKVTFATFEEIEGADPEANSAGSPV